MKTKPSVAVLGTGNQGLIMSGLLSLSGCDVSLFDLPEFADSVDSVIKAGGIDIKGAFGEGLAKPTLITKDVGEAIQGRQVLLFCMPAYAHEAFTRACAPHIEAGQLLVFISYFGALRMSKLLEKLRPGVEVTLGEFLSCPYAGRKSGPNEAVIVKRKERLPFATFPGRRTADALGILNQLFDDLSPGKTCLETSINNVNPWVHVAGVILNVGWIEATKGGFSFYTDGKTPAVKDLECALEDEKIEVTQKLHLRAIRTPELVKELYRSVLHETDGSIHRTKHKVQNTPQHLEHRYLLEDVPYGLVPVASIAQEFDLPIPALDATIKIASIVTQKDLREVGIGASELGLSGLTAEEMVAFAETGRK